MSSWKECKLGDICTDISYGYTASAKSENVGPKFLRITDIVPDRITWGNVPFCEIDDKKKEQYKLEIGDIVIARTGATTGYNKVIKDDIDSVFASYLIRYKIDKQQAFPKFIGYSLQSYEWKGFVEGIIGGSAQPGANAKQFASYDILLPPLEEQKAIAEVLSSLDDKIDLLHRQNQTLESLAQTLFRQWFIEEAKEEWEEVLITDLFEVRDGTHDSPKQKEFGKKLLTSKHILKNKLDFESSYFISEEDFEKINQRSIVEQGDILFSMIGTIGLTYLEQSNEIDYAIKNIGLFKTSQNKKFMYFVYLWLNSSFGVEFIHENRSGSTQEYISLGSLRNIIFNLPNYKIIDLFNEKMEPIFEKINTNMKQIKSLENLRDTLLPKLFSGEIKIKD